MTFANLIRRRPQGRVEQARGRRGRRSTPGLESMEHRRLLTNILYMTTSYATSTSLAVSTGGAATYGTPLTLTATLKPTSATTIDELVGPGASQAGTISFYDGSKLLGTDPVGAGITSGTFTFKTSSLGAGAHSFQAKFDGDDSVSSKLADPNGGGREAAGTNVVEILASGSSSAAQSFTIAKAPLVVKVNTSEREVDEPDPAFTVSYSGFVNGEGPGVLGGALKFSDGVAAKAAPGTYADAILASGLSSSNYAITYIPGTLIIDK